MSSRLVPAHRIVRRVRDTWPVPTTKYSWFGTICVLTREAVDARSDFKVLIDRAHASPDIVATIAARVDGAMLPPRCIEQTSKHCRRDEATPA
jgi:hypothetical protein